MSETLLVKELSKYFVLLLTLLPSNEKWTGHYDIMRHSLFLGALSSCLK